MFRDLIDEWDPYHPVMLSLLIFPILLAHTEVRIYLFSTKVLFKMKNEQSPGRKSPRHDV
jgi:hypothetical protein